MMTLADKVFYVFSSYGSLVAVLQENTPSNISTFSRLFGLMKDTANMLYEETGTTEQREIAEKIAKELERLAATTEDSRWFREDLQKVLRELNEYMSGLRNNF